MVSLDTPCTENWKKAAIAAGTLQYMAKCHGAAAGKLHALGVRLGDLVFRQTAEIGDGPDLPGSDHHEVVVPGSAPAALAATDARKPDLHDFRCEAILELFRPVHAPCSLQIASKFLYTSSPFSVWLTSGCHCRP